RLCPTHASKKGRRYRYYISKRLMHRTGAATDGWRIPAKELEASVLQTVCRFLRDELRLVEALQLNHGSPGRLSKAIGRAAAAAIELERGPSECRRTLLSTLLHRIVLHSDAICLEIRQACLASLLEGSGVAEPSDMLIRFVLPIQLRRRGAEAKLVIQPAQRQSSAP